MKYVHMYVNVPVYLPYKCTRDQGTLLSCRGYVYIVLGQMSSESINKPIDPTRILHKHPERNRKLMCPSPDTICIQNHFSKGSFHAIYSLTATIEKGNYAPPCLNVDSLLTFQSFSTKCDFERI